MKAKLFTMAWTFIKENGFNKSEALKTAWANIKLREQMALGECKFYFKKVNGEIREAHGTLSTATIPQTGDKKHKNNEAIQIYFDTDKMAWRSFKRANLVIA